MRNDVSIGRTLAIVAVSLALGACSSTSGNKKDPIEGFNRAMFAVNETIDSYAVRPVAKAYDDYLPVVVKAGVSNFFGNIDDVFTGVNNFLQGKPGDGASDLGRFVINSTIGILGMVDVASDIGLAKHDEDFGQTFGRWGVGNGPYVVLPVFGPKTARDTVGFMVDRYVDPVGNIEDVSVRNSLSALRIVSIRAELLPADKVVDEAALDKYSYVRDGYLQRRRSQIFDGDAPRDTEEE
ncbi:MAG: VacJ family lipoprotein [Rhodocyclaceae bacterium]|nr:VacJ family lipoprotein [Rhodocyclaceae bacterium]